MGRAGDVVPVADFVTGGGAVARVDGGRAGVLGGGSCCMALALLLELSGL